MPASGYSSRWRKHAEVIESSCNLDSLVQCYLQARIIGDNRTQLTRASRCTYCNRNVFRSSFRRFQSYLLQETFPIKQVWRLPNTATAQLAAMPIDCRRRKRHPCTFGLSKAQKHGLEAKPGGNKMLSIYLRQRVALSGLEEV